MNFNYTQGIPARDDNPSDDQPDMKENNDSSFGIWNIDHIGFVQPLGGYHKIIHQPDNAQGGPTIGGQSLWNPVLGSGVPTAVSGAKISGVQQTFTMDYTPDTSGGVTDTQLFTLTGNGGVSQLSGNHAASDGWCWCGGILLQWGIVSISTGSGSSSHRVGSVTFKNRSSGAIPFPNSCFSITTNLTIANSSSTSPASNTLSIFSLSATGFTWVFNTSGSLVDQPQFYWMAIGN